MGSASVCSRRTVRAAAGLGDCSAGICNSTSRPDTSSRDQHDRGFSSSCSASASGSGTSSDEELEGFNDYRRAAGQAGRYDISPKGRAPVDSACEDTVTAAGRLSAHSLYAYMIISPVTPYRAEIAASLD